MKENLLIRYLNQYLNQVIRARVLSALLYSKETVNCLEIITPYLQHLKDANQPKYMPFIVFKKIIEK